MSPPNVYTVGMIENKFKVGNKARVIDASRNAFSRGDVVTVAEIRGHGVFAYSKDERDVHFCQFEALEHIGTPTPAPEIVVAGHTYRLVEPEVPEPKEGQVWKEDDDYMIVLDEETDGGLDAVALTPSYPGMVLHNRFNRKAPRPTFVAHSLREALESGKIKAEDL